MVRSTWKLETIFQWRSVGRDWRRFSVRTRRRWPLVVYIKEAPTNDHKRQIASMMMKNLIILVPLLSLTACSPATIQDYSAAYSPDGKPAYSVDDYTKLNEVTEDDARRHAQKFADDTCGQTDLTGTIQRIDTTPNGNKLGPFLYWQAIIVCE